MSILWHLIAVAGCRLCFRLYDNDSGLLVSYARTLSPLWEHTSLQYFVLVISHQSSASVRNDITEAEERIFCFSYISLPACVVLCSGVLPCSVFTRMWTSVPACLFRACLALIAYNYHPYSMFSVTSPSICRQCGVLGLLLPICTASAPYNAFHHCRNSATHPCLLVGHGACDIYHSTPSNICQCCVCTVAGQCRPVD